MISIGGEELGSRISRMIANDTNFIHDYGHPEGIFQFVQ